VRTEGAQARAQAGVTGREHRLAATPADSAGVVKLAAPTGDGKCLYVGIVRVRLLLAARSILRSTTNARICSALSAMRQG